LGKHGLAPPVFAYALNNPIRRSDRDAKDPNEGCPVSDEQCGKNAEFAQEVWCQCISSGGTPSLVDDQGKTIDIRFDTLALNWTVGAVFCDYKCDSGKQGCARPALTTYDEVILALKSCP
jgi:hypothetical protein